MAERMLVLARGEQAILDRLDTERDDIATLERRLKAAKKRRDLLCAKAHRCGIPLRTIEPHAGITNARISQLLAALAEGGGGRVSAHPNCDNGHVCQRPSGRKCVEQGCNENAGTLWGPMWCPDHDRERLDRVSRQLAALGKNGEDA